MIDLDQIFQNTDKGVWAAVRDDNVVSLISAWCPDDVDHDAYTARVKEALNVIGVPYRCTLIGGNGKSLLQFPDGDVLRGGFMSGKYWASVRDGVAVGLVPMYAPDDVQYELFKGKVYDLLGEVVRGKLAVDRGRKILIPYGPHSSRKFAARRKYEDNHWVVTGVVQSVKRYERGGRGFFYATLAATAPKAPSPTGAKDLSGKNVIFGEEAKAWACAAAENPSLLGQEVNLAMVNLKRIPVFYRGDDELQLCKIERIDFS